MGVRTGLRALAGVALLTALYVVLALPFLALVLIAGIAVAGWDFVLSGDVVPWSLGALALVALLTELVGPRRLPAGLAVDAEEQPVLWELVADVARDLGVPAPDGIVLTGGTACELRVVRRPGTTLHRHLVLGTPVPHALTARALRVAIAHALGHSRRRRPPLADRVACHGVDAVTGLAEAGRGHGALGAAAASFAAFYVRVCAPVVRFEERAADRAASRAYGTDAVADALVELAAVRRAWDLFRSERLDPGIAAGCAPRDPVAGFRAFLVESATDDDTPPQDGASRDGASWGADELADRARRLRARPLVGRGAPAGADVDADAGALLADPAAVASHVHPYLLATDDDGCVGPLGFAPLRGLVRLPDDVFLAHVVGFLQARRAAALGMAARRAGAAYPVTVGGVLGLLVEGRGEALADAWGDDTAGALADLLAGAWVDAGRGRVRASWSDHVAVVDHLGVDLDLPAAARDALADPVAARTLRERMRAAGVSAHYEPKPPLSIADAERDSVVGRH